MIPVLIFGAVSIDVGRARGRVFPPVRPGSDAGDETDQERNPSDALQARSKLLSPVPVELVGQFVVPIDRRHATNLSAIADYISPESMRE